MCSTVILYQYSKERLYITRGYSEISWKMELKSELITQKCFKSMSSFFIMRISRLQSGPALAGMAIWIVNQRMQYLSSTLPFK